MTNGIWKGKGWTLGRNYPAWNFEEYTPGSYTYHALTASKTVLPSAAVEHPAARFSPCPGRDSLSECLKCPSLNTARTNLQLYSLIRRVSWGELREYGEDRYAGPKHRACNLHGKAIKPLSLTFVNPPLSYKTLDPREVRTNFNQKNNITLWGRVYKLGS